MTTVQRAPTPYALNNDEPTAAQMLACLSEILDEFSQRRLTTAGLPERGRCLEVGAGNGSIAAWLALQVTPYGKVIATDVKPQHVRPHPMVQVIEHDIAAQDPPPGPFDVIHARLLLPHLPNRREVLAGLVDQLAPDGVMVIEDWGRIGGMVLTSPVLDAASIYGRYQEALLRVFQAAGNDTGWAEQTADAMTAAGLVDVETEVHAESWRGGTPGCQLPIAVARELRPRLLDAGLTADDLDALVDVMTNPDTLVLGNPTFSTIGHRAEA